jgi:hypothetical protein
VEGQIEQQVAGAGNTHLAQEIAVWLEDEELSGPSALRDVERRHVDVAVLVGSDAFGMGEAGRQRGEGQRRQSDPGVGGGAQQGQDESQGENSQNSHDVTSGRVGNDGRRGPNTLDACRVEIRVGG